jgi:Carboxypeptidase regulatory-like domain/TonB dependent receptor
MKIYLRTAFVLALFACANFLLSVPADAQAIYGSLFGTVTDSSGAAVPNATVTVTDEAKGTVVSATSNGSGDYTVPHLIPDVYDLKVTAKGFKAFEAKGIPVEADTAPRIDPTMQVGAENTTVEVNADQEPELKTDRADVATVFDEQEVSSLPVGDQNFANLQLLLPGAQMLGWAHAADENPQGSKQIQIDGQAFGGVAYELDGTDNEDPILGIIVINPALDAVTETKITTQNFDAELGKAVSAVMSAQTRSGTNSFHGSVYDFRTGNANLARDPYNQAPTSYTQPLGLTPSIPPGLKNRMGASIGGPIKKDKAFFFFNYEGQRQKVGTVATDTLPTSLATETCLGNQADTTGGNGCDFSQYLTAFGAAGQIYDNTKGGASTPYPNNIIPRSEVAGAASAPSLALLKLLEPYTKGITTLDSNFNESGTGLFNSNQWTERVDYTLSEKAHAFERFSRFTDVLSGAVMFGAAGGPGFGINNYGGNSNGANDSLAAGMDIAISPKLLTDFRLGYYRYNIIDVKHDASAEFANTLGIPGINLGTSFTSGSPGFFMDNVPGGSGGTQNQPVFGDGLNVNRCNCPLTEREDQFQIVNNWTKVVGNHTFKAGIDLRYGRNLRVPSDNDRDGLLYFHSDLTSDPAAKTQGGLSFATFMLGEVANFNRYVSVSTNAKEFQKRTFSFAQDTWRASKSLTLNLGLRWDMYFPETVNGPGQGALMNLTDGYLHVAGVGGIPSDMGWTVKAMKQFSPRIGVTYQFDPKTVIRAGYGRSFDTGVFGSVFGHTVTQNLPVLANQQINQTTNTVPAFTLNNGPAPNVFPTVPSNGLLPNPGYSVGSKARPNPLHLTTVDAWNLAVQRAITPTLSVTAAYVGNKGTHTLGDGDSNSTNPNEEAVALPSQYSVTGQTVHFDPSVSTSLATGPYPGISASGGTDVGHLLSRYYGGSLPACRDPNYISLAGLQAADGDPALTTGMCGWTNSIQYNGDDQNTEFDALQITVNQSMWHGLSYGANYQWAAAFDEQSDYYTWSHAIAHGRDSNVRDQQATWYGSYDLPFGRGKQFAPGANHAEDLMIGGWQLSGVVNISGGLPFTYSYNESGSNVPNGPGDPDIVEGVPFSKGLSKPTLQSNGTLTRSFFTPPGLGGKFLNPGLDTFGDAGQNTVKGPGFWNTDLALSKSFSIWENVAAKFRMDAFNAFNHINAGNPNGNVENGGTITSGGQGYGTSQDFGPRQLEFSLRVQF